ncbi:MAG: hypothetical protein K6T54_05495 [Ignavibacterium sp.]|nr:hypothetical protein [Ignavibacterium sp.]
MEIGCWGLVIDPLANGLNIEDLAFNIINFTFYILNYTFYIIYYIR